MKILVKNIHPNPFRNLAKYPVNRNKVEKLKNSINQTGFWDNIFVRPIPETDQYQLAYGHHRLAALKEIGIQEVDIPVKEVDDSTMIQMMINENMSDWSADTVTINESVRAAKMFLDKELEKYNTWDELRCTINSLPIENEPEFRSVKSKGIGQNTLLKFMGSNWKKYMIEQGLRNMREDDILEAVETIKKPILAGGFRDAIRKVENELKAQLPAEELEEEPDNADFDIDESETSNPEPVVQKTLTAETIWAQNQKEPAYTPPKPPSRVLSVEKVKEVAQRIQERLDKNEDVPKHFKKPEDKMEVMIKQELQGKSEYDVALESIRKDLFIINNSAKQLNNTIRLLNGKFEKLNIEELKTMSSIPLAVVLTDLKESIDTLAHKIGFKN